MYVGGVENHPEIIRRVSAGRPLWGCSATAVTQVRDPFALQALLSSNGIPSPRMSHEPDVEGQGQIRWLRKPLSGVGGRGITLSDKKERGCYFQERLDGVSCSGIWIGHEGGALFLGASKQLVGTTWLHAAPFHYAGSIGPLQLTEAAHARFRALGDLLARQEGLRGLFGVDCILCDETPWPVEVNPRYTASVEVWEYAHQESALRLHAQAFERSMVQASAAWTPFHFIGKAVLFARKELKVPENGPWDVESPATGCEFNLPRLADIPPAGSTIGVGQPILSFFSKQDSVEACERELQALAKNLDRWLN